MSRRHGLSPIQTGRLPRSVEEITEDAQAYEYTPLIPLRYWLRAADTMLKEVSNDVHIPRIFS